MVICGHVQLLVNKQSGYISVTIQDRDNVTVDIMLYFTRERQQELNIILIQESKKKHENKNRRKIVCDLSTNDLEFAVS